MVVVNSASTLESRAQHQLTAQNVQCSRTERYASILSGLRRVFVDSGDARLVDCQCSCGGVKIAYHQCDLLRGPQSGKEPKFVVVPLHLAPITMDGCDQRFGFLYGERIDDGAILLANPNALESQGRVEFLRVVTVAEFECAPKDADRAVVGFLAPGCIIGNPDESRVSDIEKSLGADPRTPESVQDPSVRGERDACHVMHGHPRGTVGEEGIENLGARFR
ncbi:MAG TPA: hypothetical protein VFA39_08110 [Steroidobacteraceae bacterium]|nr:hypothetical protein [Steroidobacteraceae bacterium]